MPVDSSHLLTATAADNATTATVAVGKADQTAAAVADGSTEADKLNSNAPGSIYEYANAGGTSSSSSNSPYTLRPEAKKARMHKIVPSKVVHIRNIPQQINDIEIIQFGLIFGNIANVLNLRSKYQAFLEFEKSDDAQSMIGSFANNPIAIGGRQIFVQYSNYKSLVTDQANTNNQVARAALDLAKELHKAAQTGGQNT